MVIMAITPIMVIMPIMVEMVKIPPGLAMVAIWLLLAIAVHDSAGKAKPSSKFLLIKTKDNSDEWTEAGEDYADSSESGGGRYGGEFTLVSSEQK